MVLGIKGLLYGAQLSSGEGLRGFGEQVICKFATSCCASHCPMRAPVDEDDASMQSRMVRGTHDDDLTL